jgi:hypothetical protein
MEFPAHTALVLSGQLPQSFLWNVTMTYGAFEAGVDQAKRTQCLDRRELAIKNTYRRNRKIPDSSPGWRTGPLLGYK